MGHETPYLCACHMFQDLIFIADFACPERRECEEQKWTTCHSLLARLKNVLRPQ